MSSSPVISALNFYDPFTEKLSPAGNGRGPRSMMLYQGLVSARDKTDVLYEAARRKTFGIAPVNQGSSVPTGDSPTGPAFLLEQTGSGYILLESGFFLLLE